MQLIKTVLAASALCACTVSQAQSTLGELLDRGAQRLSPAQAQAALPVSLERQAVDADSRMTLHADGRVTGSVANKQGFGTSDAQGSWTADAQGRRCVDVHLPGFNMRWQECGYPYQLGGQQFSVASDSDRSARAVPLQPGTLAR